MITPMDLQNKKFSGSAFGYKKSEVDDFLEALLIDYEEVYLKSFESTKKIDNLNKKLESYAGMEETMKKTLLVAETAAEQVRETARKEAENIVNEAKLNAKEILAKANADLDALKIEFEQVKEQMKLFKIRAKGELQMQLAVMEGNEQ